MGIEEKVGQFRTTLHQILKSPAKTRVKIALLRSLKEELKLTLATQLKINAIEEATH